MIGIIVGGAIGLLLVAAIFYYAFNRHYARLRNQPQLEAEAEAEEMAKGHSLQKVPTGEDGVVVQGEHPSDFSSPI